MKPSITISAVVADRRCEHGRCKEAGCYRVTSEDFALIPGQTQRFYCATHGREIVNAALTLLREGV